MFNLDTYSFFHLFLGSAARGLTCPHCGVGGIAKQSKLLLHIERMHSQRITCIICNVEFVDKFFLTSTVPTVTITVHLRVVILKIRGLRE